MGKIRFEARFCHTLQTVWQKSRRFWYSHVGLLSCSDGRDLSGSLRVGMGLVSLVDGVASYYGRGMDSVGSGDFQGGEINRSPQRLLLRAFHTTQFMGG